MAGRHAHVARRRRGRALLAVALNVSLVGCLAQALGPTGAAFAERPLPVATDAVRGVLKDVRGTVTAPDAGDVVAVQQQRGGAWRTVAEAPVADGGGFDVRFRPVHAGRAEVRVVLLGRDGRPRAATAPSRVTVRENVAALVDAQPACLGAASVVDPGCENPELDGLLLPATSKLAADNGGGYLTECWQPDPTALVPSCELGSDAPDATRVALVGDSHAAMYLPGLRRDLAGSDWHVDTYLGVECRWMTYPDGDPCGPRAQDVQQRLLDGDYDVVVVTGLRDRHADAPAGAALSRRQADLWREVADAGAKVVAVGDVGYLPQRAIGCVTDDEGRGAGRCTVTREDAFPGVDPLVDAVALTPGAELVDMTDLVCPEVDGSCPLVVGHAVVYRDAHHLTGTFAKSLTPMLAERLRDAAH